MKVRASLPDIVPHVDCVPQGLGTDLVFIRLSSRSPKDAAVLSKRFDNLFIKVRAKGVIHRWC